jgi:hypothetical protein
MPFSEVLKPRSLLFGFTLCGYGIISFVVTDPEISRKITVPYRLVILIFNLILLLYNIGMFQGLVSVKSSHQSTNTIIHLWKDWRIKLLFLFIFLYSLRLLNDILIYQDFELLLEPSQYLLFWFFIVLVPALNFLFLRQDKAKKYLFLTWLFHCPIIVMACFIDASQSILFQQQGRLENAALNPIALGHYGTSMTIISMYAWLQAKSIIEEKWGKLLKGAYLVMAVMGVIVIFLAASRGPIIALGLCLPLMLFASRKVNPKFIFGIIILSIGMIFSSSFALSNNSSFVDRFFSISDEQKFDTLGGSITRTGLHRLALKLIESSPLIGFGIEIPGEGYPHNLILESFLVLGVFGGFLFMIILFFSTFKAMKLLFAKGGQWGWVAILYIQYMIGGMLSGSLYGSNMFWYLLFTVLGIRIGRSRLATPMRLKASG